MQKNTLPEMDLLDDEEMVVYVEDVDEVIETSDEAEPSNEEDDESDIPVQTRYHIPERDDAICIFDGHKGGEKKKLIIIEYHDCINDIIIIIIIVIYQVQYFVVR